VVDTGPSEGGCVCSVDVSAQGCLRPGAALEDEFQDEVGRQGGAGRDRPRGAVAS